MLLGLGEGYQREKEGRGPEKERRERHHVEEPAAGKYDMEEGSSKRRGRAVL